MKITLINPPSPFLINQKAFPPLGILYLASYMLKFGYEVKIIDLANKENELNKELNSAPSAELYGITATTPQYPWAKKISRILKKISPATKICIGGPHASSCRQRCLDEGFDFVVAGEGEQALLNIVQKLSSNSPINRLLKYPYISNLDSLPFPARDLVNISDYAYPLDGGAATTIITSRGCPFSCASCSKDVWDRNTRYLSVDYVYAEVKEIKSRFGFKYLLFLDDIFTLDKKRLLEICFKLKDLDVKWRCYGRADISREILVVMKQAGCIEIGFGLESGSQKILNTIEKKLSVEEATRFVQDCKAVGIAVNVFIMIGLPGETYETVEETKRWMTANRPDKFGFNILTPYRGTPIFNNRDKFDIKIYTMPDEDSWVKGRSDEYKSFVSTAALSRKEILRLFNELSDYYSKLLNWKPGIGRNTLSTRG